MKDLLKETLFKYYGYTDFKTPQDKIIENILNKKDTIAILPTGAGKSLTFQIPGLLFENLTIIISPLISLMTDQVQVLKKRKIAAEYLNSTLDFEQTNVIYQKILDKKVKMLYVSPEKLTVLKFLNIINQVKIDFLCVDEAHTLMWGLDFRKAFLDIKDFLNNLKIRPVVSAVSATATKETIKKIINILLMKDPVIYKTSFDRANLFYSVEKPRCKDEFIFNYVQTHKEECGIIYALTCKDVNRIYNTLKDRKISITYYHGQLDTKTKLENQRIFMEGKVKLIVCTISFGMGIDKSNIRYVINYQMPSSVEDLVQMHGRAARDNKEAKCFVLYDAKDVQTSEYFLENIKEKQVRKYKLKQLKAVVKYCQTKKCLHQYICSYFSEDLPKCNNCKNC